MRGRLFAVALVLTGFSFPCTAAFAGGLFLPAHGVRPLGRGGAFVAGGDDPGVIWYNPAGIGELSGVRVLLDASLVVLTFEYQRVDSGGNLYDPVANEGPLMPIPTLAVTYQPWKDRLTLGLSVSAPYAPIQGYPRPSYAPCQSKKAPSHCIDTVARDAPQRYSLISMDGTLFIRLELAAAVRVLPQLSVGVSLQNTFVSFVTLSSLSAYNGISSGPEDPEFDTLSQLKLEDYWNPSASFGVVVTPTPGVRIGVSYQLPVWVGGEAATHVQLPVSPMFTSSYVEGSAAELKFTLPMTVRAGVEVRLVPNLRVEAGFDWEQWSVFKELRIKPKNIFIYDIPGIDKYRIPDMVVDLNLHDTFAVRLGGEYALPGLPLVLRLGYVFEWGAVDDAHAAVLANDPDKHLVSVGASVTVARFRIDLGYAHVFMAPRNVDFRKSESKQINPINPTGAVAVGGGRYSGFADLVGLGVERAF